jgi:predicted AAA+ superfamily ATPase
MNERQNPLEDLGELFVNRDEELNKFWKWATWVPQPLGTSYALVGLRRTGKTAILHKLFNRLFHEQETVLPVYISFADYLYRAEPITIYEFADEFFVGYMRSYLAFRYRKTRDHQIALSPPLIGKVCPTSTG